MSSTFSEVITAIAGQPDGGNLNLRWRRRNNGKKDLDGRRGSPLKAVISVEAECKIMNIIEGETLATHRALSVQYTRKDFFPIQTSRAAHDEMYSVDGRKKRAAHQTIQM